MDRWKDSEGDEGGIKTNGGKDTSSKLWRTVM